MQIQMWLLVSISVLTLIAHVSSGHGSPGRTPCAEGWFDCGNDKCVAAIWTCDGENDCGNRKDEEDCGGGVPVPSRCTSSQFLCELNNHCIPGKWRCDGETDCDDGSDETQCGNITSDCTGFRCKNNNCLPLKWHCDGFKDCIDGSDEEQCPTGDSCTHSICSQQCESTPSGPRCYCNEGYTLDTQDNATCLDVDKCQVDGFCSHSCTNLPGGYRCSCIEGYRLVNGTKCQAEGADPLLIFSTIDDIRGMRLRSRQYFLIRKAIQKATAIDVDPTTERIFWIEVSNRSTIYSAKINGSGDLSTVLSQGLLLPEDIAVDYVAGNLYLTDSGLRQVLACKMDGTMCHVLHDNNVDKPRSILLDPSEGFLYWSDWGEKTAGIYRSGMDGSKRIDMVSKDIGWPNGIAVDHTIHKLFWADAKRNTIESISLDGSSRKVVLEESEFHPYSLAVFEDNIYWTDWSTFSLDFCNKFTGHKMRLMARENRKHIMGVHVYHPVLAHKVSNPCLSSQCSHLCLLSPNRNFRCACPPGFSLSSDTRTCTNNVCSRDDFECRNGRCILQSWRCDRRDDCGDNSDEVDCTQQTVCGVQQIQCGDGECIPKLWRCDLEADCSDGVDESECNLTGCEPDSQFRCTTSGQCVPKSWRCDGANDCADGTDEEDCNFLLVGRQLDSPALGQQTRCTSSDFRCEDDGSCLDESLLCDGRRDCGDGSDEKNCKKDELAPCKENMFHCSDGSCIYIYEQCDGHSDCVDDEDEHNCTEVECQIGEFRCPSTGRCIRAQWICDGDDDCRDGSDESNCTRLLLPSQTFRKITLASKCDGFTCFETGQCLPWTQVCDGQQDCRNMPDEGGYCSTSCSTGDNGGCSQICQKTPQGSRCSCFEGYRLLPDEKTCEDVNECQIPGSCSHFCNNTKGGFECRCAEGYFLHHDRRKCNAEGGPANLVYLLGDQIRSIDVMSHSQRLYLSVPDADMTSMTYDAADGLFYWTERTNSTINSYYRYTHRQNLIARSEFMLSNIKYDWLSRNLYYSDDAGHIRALSRDGRYTATLLRARVNSLDISPTTGLMFWTVWSSLLFNQPSGIVERAEMDGSTRQVIISNEINWPTAITVDHLLKIIYWIDMKLNTLECADFQGLQRRHVLGSVMYHPYSMAVFEDNIYLSDWGHDAIFRCNKFNGSDCSKLKEGSAKAVDLLLIYKVMQPLGVSRCLDSGCPHLCLPTRSSFVCKCTDNFIQVNHTCVPLGQ